MRPSLRFLAVAVVGWGGVRAATLGALPGTEMFSIERSEAKPAPIVPTEFPPIDPVQPMTQFPPELMPYAGMQQAMPVRYQPITVPIVYASAAQPRPLTPLLPDPGPVFNSRIPPLDEWPLSRIASASMPARRSSVVPLQSAPVVSQRLDRLQLTTWAMMRQQQPGVVLGPGSLASGGTLGGSQAGARLTYAFTRQIAASLRTTSDINRRTAEVAGGLRVQPVQSIPVWLTAERRQRLGPPGSGRNAFALFAESGLYQLPVGWQLSLDAYLQAGVVGVRRREGFVDGSMALTRPVFRNFSAGVGVWGGAQPGLYRIDAGPRVTMKVRNNVRVHFDWRQRLAGNALPGSGPTVTVAGGF